MFLYFPIENCKKVMVKGKQHVQADIMLTPDELILMLLEWRASGDDVGGVVIKDQGAE